MASCGLSFWVALCQSARRASMSTEAIVSLLGALPQLRRTVSGCGGRSLLLLRERPREARGLQRRCRDRGRRHEEAAAETGRRAERACYRRDRAVGAVLE